MVFYVPFYVTASISGLTIEHGANGAAGYGSDGGGIASAGTLSLSNDVFTENTGPNSGGGVYNNGILTLSDSTISNNTAKFGAGIDNTSIDGSPGMATINGCTFFGNTATTAAGGIYNGRFDSGTLTLVNVTVSGNGSAACIRLRAAGVSTLSDTVRPASSR